MVIAWIGFASIGMFIARHMKVLFGQRVLLGTKMWFTVRLILSNTVLSKHLSIISFMGGALYFTFYSKYRVDLLVGDITARS